MSPDDDKWRELREHIEAHNQELDFATPAKDDNPGRPLPLDYNKIVEENQVTRETFDPLWGGKFAPTNEDIKARLEEIETLRRDTAKREEFRENQQEMTIDKTPKVPEPELPRTIEKEQPPAQTHHEPDLSAEGVRARLAEVEGRSQPHNRDVNQKDIARDHEENLNRATEIVYDALQDIRKGDLDQNHEQTQEAVKLLRQEQDLDRDRER